MRNDLQVTHIYKYGRHLADLMWLPHVYFTIVTKENKKDALHFITANTKAELSLLGYIFIEDLLNADIPFAEKLSDKFYFVAQA